jgi:hypothetical protein
MSELSEMEMEELKSKYFGMKGISLENNKGSYSCMVFNRKLDKIAYSLDRDLIIQGIDQSYVTGKLLYK